MKKIMLYVPEVKDYWYEEKIQKEKETMEYNRGYDVNFEGYDKETGCISFPKEKWAETKKKREKENNYFAYIKDMDTKEFVGYVNYHYNKQEK